MRSEIIQIPFEVKAITSEEGVCLASTDKGYAIIGSHIVVQENTLEEATKKFWKIAEIASSYHQKRSKELTRRKLFHKGPWGEIAGNWFIVYGIQFYFRYGKGMRGGWYVPFTKLNITITNHWKL
jgi:hypothetical protein